MYRVVLICILTTFLASCKPNNGSVSKEEIYQFINHFLTVKELPSFRTIKYILDEEIIDERWNDTFYLKPSRYLSKRDISFMKKQLVRFPDFRIEQKNVPDKIIIRADSVKGNEKSVSFYDDFREKYGEEKIGAVSLPLFSADKSKVLVRVTFYTRFQDAGSVLIFERINGTWQVIAQLAHWP